MKKGGSSGRRKITDLHVWRVGSEAHAAIGEGDPRFPETPRQRPTPFSKLRT